MPRQALQEAVRASEARKAAVESELKQSQRRALQYRQENHVLLSQYESWLRVRRIDGWFDGC